MIRPAPATVLALLAVAALAACGADGRPHPVAAPGVAISGQATVGVAGGTP